jgi:predicted  nucleic acid-binding Zn-ribbon protein
MKADIEILEEYIKLYKKDLKKAKSTREARAIQNNIKRWENQIKKLKQKMDTT